ncbi:hypothetical protein GOP47_0017142 [Adiantum capillus-veneris]|uniref:Molybdenum cofactor sulfurase n=1 Tax=Adiantum capillus-veneris TaxID=13818 RepID=A0A9D4ZCC4_ADICA|nr:hypothetical protein GOP47_0017142 [Adiantum capillus-veneris]
MKVSVSYATSQDESFGEFLSLYPSYKSTMVIDALRHDEYPHLDKEGHVCLDYTGIGLFSSLQRNPELYGGFGIGLSPTSANLATHAMYMEGGSTESFFRNRILRYLSLDEDGYYIVFTANALSAFKLLAHSYPFHEAHNFLFAYDHECENIEAVRECAHLKGAHIQSANLINPLSRIDADDLRQKLQSKRKSSSQRVGNKGLFAYPYTSRVTGCKNSSQWIPEAQQEGWHVLLDATSVDAKFSESLGLALFSPDFLICSFYFVFGEDPTGFGCLVIKKSVLRTLGDSFRARAIGMVKIVTKQDPSSSPDESSEVSIHAIDPHVQLLRDNPGHRRTCSMRDFSFEEESPGNVNTPSFTELYAHKESLGLSRVGSRHGKETPQSSNPSRMHRASIDMHFSCRGLDHADMLGYKGVAVRLRTLSSWLISSLSRLRHPEPDGTPLVKFYSPWSSAEGGSIVAFTLSDSAGRAFNPRRVQMLADRNSISLGTGVIAGTISSDVQENIEDPRDVGCVELPNHKWRSRGGRMQNVLVPVVYVSLGFLNNFHDLFRLWLFISKFLDPDFISQELWHYQALNQETIEI